MKPVHHLEPLNLMNAGEPKKYFGWSFVSGTLPIKVRLKLSLDFGGLFNELTFDFASFQVADEMVHGAKDSLKSVSRNRSIEIEAYKELPTMGRDNCSGIMYVQRLPNNSRVFC